MADSRRMVDRRRRAQAMGSPWEQGYTNRNRHLYRNQRRNWLTGKLPLLSVQFISVPPVPFVGPQLQSFVPIETR